MIDALRAVSPVDGRYGKITEKLGEIAGEGGLIRYRIQVEVEWIIALSECEQISELPEFSREQKEKLRALYKEFDNSSALKVKEIEARTNHDVKAVEYFLKEAVENILPEKSAGFFHFACTSEDINSSAYALMSKDLTALAEERISAISAILKNFSEEWKNIPMLCRTHGQPATPSHLRKEMGVFLAR
jgi:adenylosuccinate lyase